MHARVGRSALRVNRFRRIPVARRISSHRGGYPFLWLVQKREWGRRQSLHDRGRVVHGARAPTDGGARSHDGAVTRAEGFRKPGQEKGTLQLTRSQLPAATNWARVAARMLQLLGVTLLQPEAIVSARVSNGAEGIGALLSQLQGLLRAQYEDHLESATRTLCVALGPGRGIDLWLSTDEGTPSARELRYVQELPGRVIAPKVKDGPIALAMVFSIGPEPPPEAELCLPDAWRVIIQASDTRLSVDQILMRLWSTAD
jgi:hypothetical protein